MVLDLTPMPYVPKTGPMAPLNALSPFFSSSALPDAVSMEEEEDPSGTLG